MRRRSRTATGKLPVADPRFGDRDLVKKEILEDDPMSNRAKSPQALRTELAWKDSNDPPPSRVRVLSHEMGNAMLDADQFEAFSITMGSGKCTEVDYLRALSGSSDLDSTEDDDASDTVDDRMEEPEYFDSASPIPA